MSNQEVLKYTMKSEVTGEVFTFEDAEDLAYVSIRMMNGLSFSLLGIEDVDGFVCPVEPRGRSPYFHEL